MSVIGEAALSAFFQVLFQKIASSNFVTKKDLLIEIKEWEKMLVSIHDVLDDAEQKKMAETSVRNWLNDLNDLAYDVEDVLDEFASETLRRKLEFKSSTSMARKFIPICCTSFSPRSFYFNSKMDSKIKEITARFQRITDQRKDLNLEKIVGGTSSKTWQRPASSCLPDEPQVYGRDEDKRKILDLLLRDASTEENVGVLPIVGMGGLGKTTLAQLVYNDESLLAHFHVKAWVCVSDNFDIMRTTKGLLETITAQPCSLNELNQVQLQLRKELAGKKFLIVLDDVWSENYDQWVALCRPFNDGAKGCRIIVTTRNVLVAKKIGNIEFHMLENISDDDCWMLFKRHAFGGSSTAARQNLNKVRSKVTSKCRGLPLAARTLGGLLRSEPESAWEDILNSNIWSLESTDILPVLMLSYYHLPSHLKRCFAYCAIFPCDYEFTKKELLLLWMAEGLVQPRNGGKQMEETWSSCFRDLLLRSLFQTVSSGGLKYVMQDLVNDLAKRVTGETYLRLEEAMGGRKFKGERVRHFSYNCSKYDGIRKFNTIVDIPNLRTFLPISSKDFKRSSDDDDDNYLNFLTKDVLTTILPKMKCLRVLSFKGYEIFEIPESICSLKHLRYFDLSFTKIGSLPGSIIFLCDLQTLILRDCERLKKLPSRIEHLRDLCCLDIEGVNLEDGLPLGVKELVSLTTLPHFPVGKAGGAGLTALKKLAFVKGELHVSGLENVNNALYGGEANLKEKKGIQALWLEWKEGRVGDEREDRLLLDVLRPHAELEELKLWNYGGKNFPSWVGDHLFQKLAVIRLKNCMECTSLPRLGMLPSLRELFVEGMSKVKSVGREFYGEGNPFPALETLCFKNMREWEDWDPCGFKFACLSELTIEGCGNLLGRLPADLSTLKKLKISCCAEFVAKLPSLPVVSEIIFSECKEVDFRNMVEFGSPNTVILEKISKFTAKESVMKELMKSKQITVEDGESLFLPALLGSSPEAAECLEGFNLINCAKLDSFQEVWFPSTITKIRIEGCDALTSLPNGVGVEYLVIIRCNSLISVGRGQLSLSLKSFHIEDCDNLESVELDGNLVKLEWLSVWGCKSLTFLSASPREFDSPPVLKHLRIKNCLKLELIGEKFINNFTSLQFIYIIGCNNLKYLANNLHKLTHLHDIGIYYCPNLLSLLQGSLPTTCLRKIDVLFCDKIEALPDNIHNFTSLQHLRITRRTPSIESFPKEGFSINLTTLVIENVMFCKPLFEWGLHRLTSLTHLAIHGGCPDILSFPCEDRKMVLPPSLIHLQISDFPKLEYFSTNGFQNLTCLESLWCWSCPLLSSFAKNGLPLSLNYLCIYNCPLLKQRCWKNKGQYWSKIHHIPRVEIDGKSAFDPDCWS